MASGSRAESRAHARRTERVLHLVANGPLRIPHTTLIPPTARAARPPTRSAWYIHVCRTAGRCRRSKPAQRVMSDGLGMPRRNPRKLVSTPSARMRSPIGPSPVSDTTCTCSRLGEAARSLASIDSAPPTWSPVMR
jgi:hypothetical protein